jgi:phosphatidylinositol glycan class B
MNWRVDLRVRAVIEPWRMPADAIAGTVIFVAAFAARLLPVFIFPSISSPDEMYSTVEQAHRLVFGSGLVTWEFVYGTKSWVLPGALAGLMVVASAFGDGPDYYMPMIGLALAALGATSALCAFLWGRRFFGTAGGIVAGSLTAVWIDAVYFGPRALSDSVAAHILVIALYASTPGRQVVVSRPRAIASGALLIVAGSLRIQLLPAIGLVGLWQLFTTFRYRRVAFVGSGLLVAVLYGAIDGLTWSYPFEALWRNVVANLYYNVQADFGVTPWYWYLRTLLEYWTGLSGVMLGLCLIGAMRLPQPFVAALLIAATLSIIGHKELRFIYPAVLLGIIVSGVGLAQLVSWIGEALENKGWARYRAAVVTCAAAFAIMVLAQLALANSSRPYNALWTGDRDMVMAARYVARMKSVCGVGILDHFWGYYAWFHHRVPLYWGTPDNPLDPDSVAFNTVVHDKGKPVGADYVTRACFGGSCVAERKGNCSSVPMTDISRPPRPLGPWNPEFKP